MGEDRDNDLTLLAASDKMNYFNIDFEMRRR